MATIETGKLMFRRCRVVENRELSGAGDRLASPQPRGKPTQNAQSAHLGKLGGLGVAISHSVSKIVEHLVGNVQNGAIELRKGCKTGLCGHPFTSNSR